MQFALNAAAAAAVVAQQLLQTRLGLPVSSGGPKEVGIKNELGVTGGCRDDGDGDGDGNGDGNVIFAKSFRLF